MLSGSGQCLLYVEASQVCPQANGIWNSGLGPAALAAGETSSAASAPSASTSTDRRSAVVTSCRSCKVASFG